MASIVALLGSLAWAAAARAETSGQQLAETAGQALIGMPAPRLELKTIDGETIDLGGLYGKKAVYLKFWATWCVPCRQQMPHFEHAFENAGPDLAVIAIDVGFNDSLDAIRRYQRQLGITMPIVFDEDGHVGAAFNLRVTPQHIVIGRDGRIQYVGHLADARLDAALLAARSPGKDAGKGGIDAAHPSIEVRHFSVGDQLPGQSVSLLEGRSFPFREPGAQRPTVFMFLSPWCESYLATTRPAVSESCRRVRQQVSALAGDGRVRWLGVASGLWAKREDLRRYRKDYKVTIPLTLDASGRLFREFRVNEVPTLIVADSHGNIVQRVQPNDAQGLKQALDRLR
ncbi:MAG: redoxin domain-containing protein [Steroidobacteraceae bacterium]